jgi:hypothetical protein
MDEYRVGENALLAGALDVHCNDVSGNHNLVDIEFVVTTECGRKLVFAPDSRLPRFGQGVAGVALPADLTAAVFYFIRSLMTSPCE